MASGSGPTTAQGSSRARRPKLFQNIQQVTETGKPKKFVVKSDKRKLISKYQQTTSQPERDPKWSGLRQKELQLLMQQAVSTTKDQDALIRRWHLIDDIIGQLVAIASPKLTDAEMLPLQGFLQRDRGKLPQFLKAFDKHLNLRLLRYLVTEASTITQKLDSVLDKRRLSAHLQTISNMILMYMEDMTAMKEWTTSELMNQKQPSV